MAAGLSVQGIGAGDRVALVSGTRYEWTVFDYALWWLGAVSVPVYSNASVEQVRAVLGDARVVAAIVEGGHHSAVLDGLRDHLPDLRQVWRIDHDLERLETAGVAVSDADLESSRRAVSPTSLASLVYTSGTTGRQRGCMLTHGNFLAEAAGARAVLRPLFEEQAATLLFLPLPHIFARVVQVAGVCAGVTLGHSGAVRLLVDDLVDFAPTFLLAVPRVYEQLYTAAAQHAAADGWGRRFSHASEVAIAYSRAREEGRVSPLLRARHRLFERTVYPRLRASFGTACRFGVSGGAPLGDRLSHLYRGMGMPLLEGYGLSETTGAAMLSAPGSFKIGFVGQPLPGTTVRVASDGELLVKGPAVMSGYWDDPAGTDLALTADGWLRTGDVGEIDDEGFVRVTGRKQEILVTAGGKVVSPEPLEDRLRAHPLVSQAMVVGDGRPFLAAVVTLDRHAARAWAQEHGLEGRAIEDDVRLRAEIQGAVDAANESVSPAEWIRGFLVSDHEWTEAGGELTASLKLRRDVIRRRLRREIDDLYE